MRRPSISTIALSASAAFLLAAGGATAAALITGADVKDGSLTGADISGRTHLQFKGTTASGSSSGPIDLIGIDNGPEGGNAVRSRPDRQVIAKADINVPFTGRLQATGTVVLDMKSGALSFGNEGTSYGNCSLDITRKGAEAPRGRYQLAYRERGVAGQYKLWGGYDVTGPRPTPIGDWSAEITAIGGQEITAPGIYTVYLTCANTRAYPGSAEIVATGRFEAQATAN